MGYWDGDRFKLFLSPIGSDREPLAGRLLVQRGCDEAHVSSASPFRLSLPRPWVERVAQPVTDQVGGEHRGERKEPAKTEIHQACCSLG